MEQMNALVGANPAAIAGCLLLLVLILLGLVVSLLGRMSALQKKYDFFTQGKEANIDEVLTATLNELQQTQQELAELQQRHKTLHEQVQGCLQTVKLTRYDAYDSMGGRMSYSLLLADARKNGLILTSIYGRDDSRCFAKDLKEGKSSFVLAEEEQELLK